MEALQTAVASCPPLPPLSCCSSHLPLERRPSPPSSSFTPISASQAVPLSFEALKAPTKVNRAIAATDLSQTHRARSLILMRRNAAAGYAAALVQIGQSQRILDLIYADIKKLAAFLQLKQLHGCLLDPSIADTHKKKILACIANEAAFLPYTLKVLNLMVDKKRAALLKDMVKEFAVIYRKITTTEMSLFLSATQLHPTQLASIASISQQA